MVGRNAYNRAAPVVADITRSVRRTIVPPHMITDRSESIHGSTQCSSFKELSAKSNTVEKGKNLIVKMINANNNVLKLNYVCVKCCAINCDILAEWVVGRHIGGRAQDDQIWLIGLLGRRGAAF